MFAERRGFYSGRSGRIVGGRAHGTGRGVALEYNRTEFQYSFIVPSVISYYNNII